MVTTLPAKVSSTGYAIRSIEMRNGHSEPSLLLQLAESADPSYLRQDFAAHLQQFLRALYPKLTVDVESFSEGQKLSVIGYDSEQTRIEIAVRSGDERDRQVLIQPSLDKYIATNGAKSIDPRKTVKRYMSALETDLVSE